MSHSDDIKTPEWGLKIMKVQALNFQDSYLNYFKYALGKWTLLNSLPHFGGLTLWLTKRLGQRLRQARSVKRVPL